MSDPEQTIIKQRTAKSTNGNEICKKKLFKMITKYSYEMRQEVFCLRKVYKKFQSTPECELKVDKIGKRNIIVCRENIVFEKY